MGESENNSNSLNINVALIVFGVILAAVIIYALFFRSGNEEDVLADLEARANQAYISADYELAERLCLEFKDRVENVNGLLHPNTAGALNNLGLIYQARGEHEKALESFERALRIYETTRGKEHPSVAASLLNLTIPLESMGRYDEAAAHMKTALELAEKAFGPENPNVLKLRDDLEKMRLKSQAP